MLVVIRAISAGVALAAGAVPGVCKVFLLFKTCRTVVLKAFIFSLREASFLITARLACTDPRLF